MFSLTLTSSCFDCFFVNKSLELPFHSLHLSFLVICWSETMSSLNEWNWNSIKLFIPFWHCCVFQRFFWFLFWESLLLLNHLKLIYSNVRGYWVFIQKHFIPLFEIKAKKNEWDLFHWYLVPQIIKQGGVFDFWVNEIKVFERVNKEIFIMICFML